MLENVGGADNLLSGSRSDGRSDGLQKIRKCGARNNDDSDGNRRPDNEVVRGTPGIVKISGLAEPGYRKPTETKTAQGLNPVLF